MRNKLLIAAAVLVAIVGVFVIVVAAQPSEYHVERSATMNAPPSAVFEQVNDLRNWDAWSPWAKLDPNAKNSFEGPTAGKGAIFKWSGNDKIGEGKMTIIDSHENESVKYRLEFVRPFEDTGESEFQLKPEGEKTLVTWSMYGKQNFMGKAMCLFMNMDKMIGADFEKGLASLQQIVEAKPAESDPPPAEGSEKTNE